jgi:serine/threonine protein kinase
VKTGGADILDCPDADMLAAFLDNHLSDHEAAELERHIDRCATCRMLLSASVRSAWPETREPTPIEEEMTDPDGPGADILLPGQTVAGRFRIKRELGSGAMGVVYAAEDLQLRVPVALKLLRGAHNRPELLERLHHEIVLSRRISHPNVCRTYDLGQAGGTDFIIMELVEGESLQEILDHGPMPLERAVSILRQLCSALAAAHQQGVVHRDIKPGNVMLCPNGRAVIMDFGLARDVAAERSSGKSMLAGTPAYWAPEQSAGGRATPQSDIYSLGVMACVMLGGQRPRFDRPLDLSGVPMPFRRALKRCLQYRPERRYGSLERLEIALIRARRVERGSWLVPASIALLAAIAIGVGIRLLWR